MENNHRFNEADCTVRSLSLLFVLFAPEKEIVEIFAQITAYIVFFCSIVLRMSLVSVGILQLIQLLNSDSNLVYDILGIDNVALWKIRGINSVISLLGVFVMISCQSLPIFYFRIFRVMEPDDTWIVNTISTTLSFISFKLIIIVQLQKAYNNLKIIKMVN
jgi:hypothetical protein